jgi:hypothetical protein
MEDLNRRFCQDPVGSNAGFAPELKIMRANSVALRNN